MSPYTLVTLALCVVGACCFGTGWVLGRTYTPRVRRNSR